MKMGGMQSRRQRSTTSEWKDNSKIDSKNIIQSSRRRSNTNRYSGYIESIGSSRRRSSRSENRDSIGGNDTCALGKRKEPPTNNIDTSSQQQNNTNREMHISGNHDEKHDSSLHMKKGSFIHKSNENPGINGRSDRLVAGLPISNEEQSDFNRKMNSNSIHSEKQDVSCLSKRNGSPFDNNSDNDDSNDSGLLDTRKELLMTTIDTSNQQRSHTNEKTNDHQYYEFERTPKFRELLYTILEDSVTRGFSDFIRWLPKGDAFFIAEASSFERNFLHIYTRIKYFQSFEDYLIWFGFGKTDREGGSVYKHRHFRRGEVDELALMEPTTEFPQRNPSLDRRIRQTKVKSKENTLIGFNLPRSNPNDDQIKTRKQARTKATTSTRLEFTKSIELETKKPKNVATTIPRGNLDRISKNNDDTGCPSAQKEVSIDKNSETDNSNDSCLLNNGKEKLMNKIDTSSQQQSNTDPKMNSNHNSKCDSSCSSPRKRLFVNKNVDNYDNNYGCLFDDGKELSKIDPSSQQHNTIDSNTNCNHGKK
mmetsp:Transcript_3121/g.8453  ORF Transcript_3121/g.8453 Transcript_3121/m.8453 type:complete len:534 (-) Transcript_3121:1402-3003(-)